MDYLAPLGPVYQAGTLSGNPVAMAAGIANLEELSDAGLGVANGAEKVMPGSHEHGHDAYARLEALGAELETGLKDAAAKAKVPVQFNRCGSMFCAYFTREPVHNLADAMKSDRERFKKYFHGLLDEGIYLAPSQFEAGFISTAHTAADIEKTVRAATKVLQTL
jgi:glutamate-1-semialdehyde 2,1-aminomutase